MTDTAVGRATAPLSPEEAAAAYSIEERMQYWNRHPENNGRSYATPDSTAALPRSATVIRNAANGEYLFRFTRAFFDADAQPTSPNFYRTIPNWGSIQANLMRVEQGLEPFIDVNDPRVRHLFVNAAKTAIEHDWCPVYDEVAKQSGVPTRAQLRATGELESGMSLKFRIEFPFYERFTGVRNATEAVESMNAEQRRAMMHRLVDRLTEGEIRHGLVVWDHRSF